MSSEQQFIPQAYALAHWEYGDLGVSSFRITDIRNQSDAVGPCTHGACNTDWAGVDTDLLCRGMFMDISELDFKSDDEWNKFIEEFSKIEGFQYVLQRFLIKG